jgi:peroxiredoxin
MAPEVRGARLLQGLIERPAGALRGGFAVLVAIAITSAVTCPVLGAETAELRPVQGERSDFTLRDSIGADSALAAHRGRTVLVHFFATWCEPCREELPALRRLVERAGDQKLSVVAISVAEVPIRVRRFIEQMPVNFPILLDEDRAVSKAWGVHTLPTTFVLDAELRPRLAVEREYDWDQVDAASLREKLSREE